MLEVNQLVMVYEDPITETKPEGRAYLLHRIEDLSTSEMERWEVCFENEQGTTFERDIKPH